MIWILCSGFENCQLPPPPPPHPDPVVETSSLSAVQPPEPIYNLSIKDDLEISKALSCSQIETLVYACQRHLQHLSSGARAGFFIGDSAGVGKGRTIAGLIWENWRHKRRKALWITFGSDLKFAARRDLDYVGASCIEVHALNQLPYSKLDSRSVGISEGVVVLTYSSLIASSAKGCNRLQQLVQWCGPEYDGLMIFGECHKAKNLVPGGGQPTQTGKAVLEIQAQLLQARVIYCSATGALEPCNMGYMVRLGLWGVGTSFLSFRNFLGAMKKGGVGALECVAMGMKARGMYVCHTLSYKGAEFEAVEGPLEVNLSYEEARVRDLEKIKRKGKDILKRHNSKGNDTVKIKVEDYIGLRNELLELGAQIYETGALVEKRYNRSSNSLKWNKDRVRELESKLASLEQLTELVEHYKHSSEEQSKNVRELEGTVTALEIYLVRVEDDYKQKFENEALAKKEIEKLTELVEYYKESSDEWSKKVRELEGTVTALEKQNHLIRIEDNYQQKPENEMLAKKEIDKLTKLVELHKGSSEEWSQKARKLEEMVTVLEELLLGNDAAATIERQFSSEISRLTELVELYKDSSEEWSKMARDLEGTVMVLEKGKNALPRRKATWSEKEVQALIAGVEKYGTGFWRQILKDAE